MSAVDRVSVAQAVNFPLMSPVCKSVLTVVRLNKTLPYKRSLKPVLTMRGQRRLQPLLCGDGGGFVQSLFHLTVLYSGHRPSMGGVRKARPIILFQW